MATQQQLQRKQPTSQEIVHEEDVHEEEIPLCIAEILAEHAERTERAKKTTNLVDYVSGELAQEYPRVSQDIYQLKREVTLIPSNAEKIYQQFLEDTFFSQETKWNELLKAGQPTIVAVIPLVLTGRYEPGTVLETVDLDLGIVFPRIHYFAKNLGYQDRAFRGSFVLSSSANTRYMTARNANFYLQTVNGTQDISIEGTWSYRGAVKSCKVKVPLVPEVASDRATEAQARYFGIVAEAKKQDRFKGKVLLQPEVYIAWIPTEDQFELKVKEVPQLVHRDPALLLRVNRQYDHLVALWDGPNEIPLESIIRKYTK